MRQIVLDTETTGLEAHLGHRLIEIGAVEMIGRRPTGNHFHTYLNPERAMSEDAWLTFSMSFCRCASVALICPAT